MKGKCNCGKKATCEYLVQHKGISSTLKFCPEHKPKYHNAHLQLIYGK